MIRRAAVAHSRVSARVTIGDGVRAHVATGDSVRAQGVGDAERHLGVVAPLSRLVGTEAPALHHGWTIDRARRATLVGDAEGIATRLCKEHAGGAVQLLVVECAHGPDVSFAIISDLTVRAAMPSSCRLLLVVQSPLRLRRQRPTVAPQRQQAHPEV